MAKKVTVYSTPTCVYCKMLKDFLKKRSVPYTDLDVASDMGAREEMFEKSHQKGVPVVDVDGEIFVGFNRAELEQVLELQ